jgi:hypothetical protein
MVPPKIPYHYDSFLTFQLVQSLIVSYQLAYSSLNNRMYFLVHLHTNLFKFT